MWWIINVIGLIASWHFADIESASTLQSTICPIFVGIFLLGLIIKIVFVFAPGGSHGGHSGCSGGGFFDSFFDGGGDGNGSCGGDGGC